MIDKKLVNIRNEIAKIKNEDCQKLFETMVNEPYPINVLLERLGIKNYTFMRAINSDPELLNTYNTIQKYKAEIMAEKIYTDVYNEPDSAKARAMLEVTKWYTAKINPQKYGDKLEVNVSGSIDLNQAIIDAKKRVEIIDAEIIEVNDDIDIFK